MNSAEFIDPRTLPYVPLRWRGELPHLYKEGCTYFVTFRMFDAIRMKHGTHLLPKKEAQKDIAEWAEPVLTSGSCALRDPKFAGIVQDALLKFADERYGLSAWCIMPNHVHLVITPLNGYALELFLKLLRATPPDRLTGSCFAMARSGNASLSTMPYARRNPGNGSSDIQSRIRLRLDCASERKNGHTAVPRFVWVKDKTVQTWRSAPQYLAEVALGDE